MKSWRTSRSFASPALIPDDDERAPHDTTHLDTARPESIAPVS
jgi:hypothetical protein